MVDGILKTDIVSVLQEEQNIPTLFHIQTIFKCHVFMYCLKLETSNQNIVN